MTENSLKLKIYPLHSDFVARVEVNEDVVSRNASLVETIVIVDRSGSMMGEAGRIVNRILPRVFTKLGYAGTKLQHIIPFNNEAYLMYLDEELIKTVEVKAQGGTSLSPAVSVLHKNLHNISRGKPVRLLTISDGKIDDQWETSNLASEFAHYVKDRDFIINSQAVRFFTSASQPDTTALASLLQVNTTTNPKLIDIPCSECDEVIAQKIADLFIDDKLDYHQVLKADDKIIVKTPWDPKATDQIVLKPGENIFWLKEVPKKPMTLEDAQLYYFLKAPLTLDAFQKIISGLKHQLAGQMKVLKVVGTSEADEKIAKMVEYFKETEKMLMEEDWELLEKEDEAVDRKETANDQQTIAQALKDIANQKIDDFNAAKKAEYLQSDAKEGKTAENPSEPEYDDDEFAEDQAEDLLNTAVVIYEDETEEIQEISTKVNSTPDKTYQNTNKSYKKHIKNILNTARIFESFEHEPENEIQKKFDKTDSFEDTGYDSMSHTFDETSKSVENSIHEAFHAIAESRVVGTLKRSLSDLLEYFHATPTDATGEDAEERPKQKKSSKDSKFINNKYLWVIASVAAIAAFKMSRRN